MATGRANGPIPVPVASTVTYTTTDKVAQLLQRPVFASSGATPTSTVVTDFILRAEGIIDAFFETAWRNSKVTEELHTIQNAETTPYWTYPLYVQLNFGPALASSVTYPWKIEVWNGSAWVDWVATKTLGMGSDYYIDYAESRIYFKKGWPMFRHKNGIRVTYYFGSATVPRDIEDLATRMAAKDVLLMDTTRVIASGGHPGIERPTVDGTLRMLDEDIKRRMDEMKWTVSPRRALIV